MSGKQTLKTLLLAVLFLSCSLVFAHADILEHWTTNQVSTNSFSLDCVVYANHRYVAYGEHSDYGIILTSEDGINWIQRVNGQNPGPFSGFSYSIALVYTGNRFFALGGFGDSAVSTDGTNWTMFSHPFQVGLLSGAAYGNSRYVAVGASPYVGSGIISSSDSTTWAFQTNLAVSDVAFGRGRFVAITENTGFIYTSSIGTTWARLPIPGGSQISFCNGLFIIPFVPGTNLLSTDGINWSQNSTGIGITTMGKVSYANGLFIAPAGFRKLATSLDGTNWVVYAQQMPGNYIRGFYIATDGFRLVTVGGSYTGGANSYNGFTYFSDVLAGLWMTNATPPQIALSGLIGRSYQIQSVDDLENTNGWGTNVTLQLPSNPYVWSDPTATNSQRFYRAVLPP